jgi:hypothetical protein
VGRQKFAYTAKTDLSQNQNKAGANPALLRITILGILDAVLGSQMDSAICGTQALNQEVEVL